MTVLTREPGRGWVYGEHLLKAVYNLAEIQEAGLQQYDDNSEYSDYFLTTDEWRLRVKVCRVTYSADPGTPWHHQTLATSDCAIFVMSGTGEALLDTDRWERIRPGDLFYSQAGQMHGVRVCEPDQEIWYLSVEGPGPVVIGDVDGKPRAIAGNGAPDGRVH